MNGRLVLVAAAGAASGSRAAAAALACAGSGPERPALLIEAGGRRPRPTLVASAGARELEERLAVHLPRLGTASRGQICQLAVPGDADGLRGACAALPLVRDSAAVLHLPPGLLHDALGEPGLRPAAALLRADLASDRALTALAVRGLLERGLLVRVLKRPLAWLPARRALFGALPPEAPGGLPPRLRESLLESRIPASHPCYAGGDDEEADTAGAAQQERRGDAGAGRGRGLHRDAEREAGR